MSRGADPRTGGRGMEVAGVDQRTRRIIEQAFANPLEIPPVFKGWLEAYLEPVIVDLFTRRLSSFGLEGQIAVCGTSLTLTTSFQDIPDLLVTLGDVGAYVVIGNVDVTGTATGWNHAVGQLVVTNGSSRNSSQIVVEDPGTANFRVPGTQIWIVDASGVGAMVKLQMEKLAAGGTVIASVTHSNLLAFKVG